MKRVLLASVAVVVAWSSVAQAQREVPCAPRPDVVKDLRQRHAEVQQAIRVVNDGNAVLEIWAAPLTRTWTLLHTNTSGLSCVVGAGKNFEPDVMPRRVEAGR